MVPGELLTDDGEHPLNTGRRTLTVLVQNTADRPIQVGSHTTLPKPTVRCVLTAWRRAACG